jgi:STE24 endopeptidase
MSRGSPGADALAKAAAYTTGSQWLLLWNLLVSALVAWLIVRSGVLDRVNARLGTRGSSIKAFVIAILYFFVANPLSLPWSLYEEWWRELSYGRISQPLDDFLGQFALSVAVFGVPVGVYALIRRAGRFWWAWSGGLTAVALSIFLLAGPVFIEPLFNDYKPVPAGEVRDALVVMAKLAGGY